MNLALLGYGRMGRAVEAAARERGHSVVLILDADENPEGRGITPEAMDGVDVAVDFSVPGAAVDNIRRTAEAGVDLVVGTTGWEERRSEVEEAVRAAGVGLLHAPNFSIGVNLFFRVVEEAARLLAPFDAYDAHLVEAHHRHKVDHPSGTARKLTDILLERLPGKKEWSKDLPDEGALDPSVLQVSVIRAGEVAGMHAVGFDGAHDRIEVRHEARGREGFAGGAVLGAEWIRGKAGVFSMEDFLADRTGYEERG